MKILLKQFSVFFFVLFLSAIAFESCKKEEAVPPVTHERGEISQISSINTYTTSEIQQILDATGADFPFELKHGVEVLSVNYYTVNANGNQLITSGAFFIPQGAENLPLMSLQHGTETKRNLVASVSPNNSTEGIIALLTASMGYATVVADYPGFGISQLMHPYMHAKSLVPCVIDFMRAFKTHSSEKQIALNGQVFLIGYSEGGYLSLMTQKVIETDYANEFTLKAVAPCAGPYDLKGMTDSIFQQTVYSTPAYVAFILTAYDEIYGWNRLDDIFNATYSAKMPGLFNGSKTWGEIVNQLPETFSELMNLAFVQDYNNGTETNLVDALQENTLLNWTPQAPIHFFHGDADQIVPFQNVITARDRLIANGGTNIQLTTIPGGSHETAGPAAITASIQWFESF